MRLLQEAEIPVRPRPSLLGMRPRWGGVRAGHAGSVLEREADAEGKSVAAAGEKSQPESTR